MTPSVDYTVKAQKSIRISRVLPKMPRGVVGRWRRDYVTGGQVGHEQEKERVGGYMKVEIYEAVY